MARNDRIPEGVRKEINKLGPGRYLDPSTGRIYVDSADMDDAFEEMIDDTAASDQARIDEYERLRKLPRPPQNVQDQAHDHLARHALRIGQRVEDRSWKTRAQKRRKFLLGKKKFKQGIGLKLSDKDLQELRDLDEALAPAADGNTETEAQENDSDEQQGTTGSD